MRRDTGVLRELCKDLHTRILTREEEIELGKQIQKDLKAHEKLLKKWEKSGHKGQPPKVVSPARDQMVVHNMRLVISLAKRWQYLGVDLQDLIQEGSVALVRAADMFDPDRGCRFATYATWWIRQGFQRAIEQTASTIRIPANVYNLVKKYSKLQGQYLSEKLRPPKRHELLRSLKCSGSELVRIIHAEQLLTIRFDDLQTNHDSNAPLTVDDIPDPCGCEPIEDAVIEETRSYLYDLLRYLKPKDHLILELRYGMVGRPLTLDGIGQLMGVSKERIRQLLAKALDKLRKCAKSNGGGKYHEMLQASQQASQANHQLEKAPH